MKMITIRWDGDRTSYYVTEPNWDGGDVYLASEVDVHFKRLKWEHESIEGMQRDRQAKQDARIAELERALRSVPCLDPAGCCGVDCLACKAKQNVGL